MAACALQVGPAPDGRLSLHHLSALDDLPAGLDQQGPLFDARERVSYQRARTSLRAGWNPVSAFQSVGSLGMGMSAPLLAADGSGLQGVVSVGLTLAQISRSLSARFADGNGLAFIAEPDGQLLATSVPETLTQTDNNGSLAKRGFVDMKDERLRALGQWFGQEQAASQRLVTIAGVRYALDQRPVQLPGGLSLVLGVLIEERELQGSMWGMARTAALWVLAISVAGGLMLLGALRHVQRRVRAVSEAARRLADGDRRARAPENIPVLELRTLAQSFNRMSCQVEAVVSGLEGEVASRTQALEAANAELQRLVALDGLTQIANRRQFDAQLQLAWRRGLRHHQPVALLLIDVDDFKAYNDHYGHPAGDEVLRQVARLLQAQQRRPDDLAARYGGEEFVLLLPDAPAEAALQVAQALLTALRQQAMPHAKSRVGDRVSVSVGVAAMVPDAGVDAQALVNAADAMLYAAKQAGRDRALLAPGISHDEKL